MPPLPDPAMALLGWLMQPSQPPIPSIEDLVERPEWMDRAACRGRGTDAFFPSRRGRTRAAKAMCAGCEVRAECLAYALDDLSTDGVWGRDVGPSATDAAQCRDTISEAPSRVHRAVADIRKCS
jgi:hypothetical protein